MSRKKAGGTGRAVPPPPASLFHQSGKPRLELNIKKQNAARPATPTGTIAKRLAHLPALLAHARKHNAPARPADALQVLQLAARYNVEAAAQAGKVLEDRQVAVGFHREAERVRQTAETGDKFLVSVANRRLAVNVRGRTGLFRDLAQRHTLAANRFARIGTAPGFFPGKVWRERRRLNKS